MADPESRAQPSFLRTALWLAAFILIAFAMRSYFAAQVGFDEPTERHLFTGNDPYYHWHTTTWVMEHGSNIDFDPSINYPEGRDNPNPPLWTWTSAFVAGTFEAIGVGGPDYVGTALNVMVAVWGALCIIPIFMITKDLWGRRAGLWASFFMAVSAPHIQRSVWGYADHDAISMFFILLAFAFIVRAFKAADLREHVAHWNRGSAVASGLRDAFRRNHDTLLYATLAGISVTACAVIWKGYPYVFGIIALAAFFQLVLDHLRNRDSTVTWLIYTITIAVGTLLPWLLYYQHQPWQIDSTVEPSLYVLAGVFFLGLALVPTRDLPSVVVFPALLVGAVLGILYLMFYQESIWNSITTGLGYFQQSKLYSTIGEAQRPQLGQVAATLGFFTFLLAFWGFFRTLRVGWRGDGPNILVAAWAIVAIFMMFAASRFEVNAAPLFCVLLGYSLDRIVAYMGLEEMRKRFRSSHGQNPVSRSFRSLTWKSVTVALGIALLLVLPTAWLGVDAAMPHEYKQKNVHGLADYSRNETTGDWNSGVPRLGAFGISFGDIAGDEKWVRVMTTLSTRDTCKSDATKVCQPGDLDYQLPDDRPAFVAWWDYGHWAVAIGKHPTVADPFQSHHEMAGRFLASDSEEEGTKWLTVLLLMGDKSSNGGQFSQPVQDLLSRTDPDLLTMDGWHQDYATVLDANVNSTDIFDFYDDVCTATGKCVGYFGVSRRMYPSGGGGIFYAPVFLADKNPDEYIQTQFFAQFSDASIGAKTLTIQDYEMVDNRSVRLEKRRYVEESTNTEFFEYQGYLYPQGKTPLQGYDPNSGVLIDSRQMRTSPTQKFVSTLFARAFGGDILPGSFNAQGQDTGRPAGDGLKHWRTVDETSSTGTLRDEPTAVQVRGVVLLAYYRGVTVNGRIVDDDGAPLPGRWVSFRDGFGATHGEWQTNATGHFSAQAPFSVNGDLTFQVMSANQQQALYNDTSFQFTVEQARRGDTVSFDAPIVLRRGTISGVVYEEKNGNLDYEPGIDTPVAGAAIKVGGHSGEPVTTTGADGTYTISNVKPDTYVVVASKWPEYTNSTTKPATVTSGGTATVNIGLTVQPSKVNATFLDLQGKPVQDIPMVFSMAGGQSVTRTTDANGVALADLVPGTWTVTVDHNVTVTPASNETAAVVTHYGAQETFVVERGVPKVVTVSQRP